MTPEQRRVSPEQRRALEILVKTGQRGSAVSVLTTTHSFAAALLANLVRDGLAAMSIETVAAGGTTVELAILRITDAGLRALDG